MRRFLTRSQSVPRFFQRQWPFFRSIDSSQLIPASRMRWIIVIAARHRSISSFCRALKSRPVRRSEELAGNQFLIATCAPPIESRTGGSRRRSQGFRWSSATAVGAGSCGFPATTPLYIVYGLPEFTSGITKQNWGLHRSRTVARSAGKSSWRPACGRSRRSGV